MDSPQGPSRGEGPVLTPAARRLLTQRLRGRSAAGPRASATVPRLSPRPAKLPLSPAQQRLHFLDQIGPGGTEYLMPAAWRLTGPLDTEALRLAVGDLVGRHEQLRTRFPVEDGVACQETLPAGPAPLDLLDLSAGEAGRSPLEAARRAVLAAATRPFDLAAEPPFRVTLFRLADADHILLLAMHHIVSDAWSLGIIGADLRSCYRDRLAGRVPPVPQQPISYGDFAAWQRTDAASARVGADLAHWREQLADLPRLELPTDHPRPAEPTGRGAVHDLVLSPAESAALRDLAERSGATMFMTLLAGFQLAVGLHTGQEDIAIGTVVANRELPETEPLVGFFVNTLVLRGDLSGNPSTAGYLRRVRETVLGALDHQELPFERLVDELSPERDLTRNPLFQVLFAYESAAPAQFALGEARGEVWPIDAVSAKFDLSLHVSEGPDTLTLSFVHREDLFDTASVAALAEHTRRALAALAADPDTPLGALDLLDGRRARGAARGRRARHRPGGTKRRRPRPIPVRCCPNCSPPRWPAGPARSRSVAGNRP